MLSRDEKIRDSGVTRRSGCKWAADVAYAIANANSNTGREQAEVEGHHWEPMHGETRTRNYPFPANWGRWS